MRPLEPLSLRQNFAWTFLGNTLLNFSLWLLLVVIAKFGSAAALGRFALGSAVASPFLLLANLQLRVVQATDTRARHSFDEYLAVRFLASSAALAVLIPTALVAYGGERSFVIIAFGLAKAIESISDVHYGLFQQHERMDLIGKSMVSRGALGMLAFAAGFIPTGSVLAGVGCLGCANVVALVVWDMRNSGRLLGNERKSAAGRLSRRIHFLSVRRVLAKPASLWSVVALAWPLGCVMMLVSLETNLPRYFVEARLGEHELGIFSALVALTAAGGAIVGSLAQAATPRLARLSSDGNSRGFVALSLGLIGLAAFVGAVGVLVAWAFGKPLLKTLYTFEYAEYSGLFVLVMLAGALAYIATALGAPVSALRWFKSQLWVHAAVVLLMSLSLAFLVGSRGLRGAAVVQAMGAALVVLGYGLMIWGGTRGRHSLPRSLADPFPSGVGSGDPHEPV